MNLQTVLRSINEDECISSSETEESSSCATDPDFFDVEQIQQQIPLLLSKMAIKGNKNRLFVIASYSLIFVYETQNGMENVKAQDKMCIATTNTRSLTLPGSGQGGKTLLPKLLQMLLYSYNKYVSEGVVESKNAIAKQKTSNVATPILFASDNDEKSFKEWYYEFYTKFTQDFD